MAVIVPVDSRVTQQLLDWYAGHKRDLPWRRTKDPYRIWVSEVMLQQTQVATVIPYYKRFLDTFATLQALAAASLDQVLAAWRGLGYYTRARSMHRTAQIVADKYQGRIPSTLLELSALPGIGAYSAGAILSIAYGARIPAIDANVRRVICRLYDIAADPRTPAGGQLVQKLVEDLLSDVDAGKFNQALMELGAMVCTSGNPRCAECPLAQECLAFRRGTVPARPVTSKRQPNPVRNYVCALVVREGHLLLARRIPSGLLGGLWELPGGELLPNEDPEVGLARLLAQNLQIRLLAGEQVSRFSHAYTHFTARVAVYHCSAAGDAVPSGSWDNAIWVIPGALQQYGLTGVSVKALAMNGYPISPA